MKILVTEKIAPAGIQIMRDAAHQVDELLDLSAADLVQTIPAYDALVVRSATQVSREVIEAGVNLKVIGRAGVGVDNVDVEAATEHGVIVCNAPTSNIVSAAEQTFALMLATARHTAAADASMKAHRWDRNKFSGTELYQKTLAIIGIGRIGGLVATRARAFDMECIGYDPYTTQERAAEIGVTLYDNLADVLPLADFFTVHMPLTKETHGMFSTAQFAAMKDGVILVNAARGGIYDLDALAEAIKSGKVAGAGIDVYETEPCLDSPLHDLDQAVLAPHLGATTAEAQIRAGIQTAEFVNLGLAGKMVPTAVNVPLVPDDVMTTVRPYAEAALTAGKVLSQLAGSKIESLTVRAYGELAKNDITLLGAGALRGIFADTSEYPVNFVNASYIAEQHGVKVTTEASDERSEYSSKASFEVRTASQSFEVSVTTYGVFDELRLISMMGYKLDLAPGKFILIFIYQDKPGQLGKIGTILGEAGINISTMVIGNRADNDRVVVMMNVDDPVPSDLMEKIVETVGSEQSWFIRLD